MFVSNNQNRRPGPIRYYSALMPNCGDFPQGESPSSQVSHWFPEPTCRPISTPNAVLSDSLLSEYLPKRIYELIDRDRADVTAVGWRAAPTPGVCPTFTASTRRVVQHPSTIFCIQPVSSPRKTSRLPSGVYVPNLAGSTGAPTAAGSGVTSECRIVLVACISSNSMHCRTIW